MNKSIEEITAEFRINGPRQFAGWNQEAFDSYVEGPGGILAHSLSGDKGKSDAGSMANYIRLVFEGVGAGWLQILQRELPPPTFLAHCLATIVPYKLAGVSQTKRSGVLRTVWNLGEGMAKEAQWLNQFLITRTSWSTDLQTLDQHVAQALTPILSPLPAATWNGRCDLHVINLYEHSVTFVPGRLYLASPAVLCVENRLNSFDTLAILLQKMQKPEVLGSVRRLPEHQESFVPPLIETGADSITINGTQVPAPLITSPLQMLCVASGFVVVSADDSQRLWLVEAA